MSNLLLWVQIGVAVLLVAAILLQQKGAGLGSAFGGSLGGQVYRSKRGLEKALFWATVILAILFMILAFLSLVTS